jgi:hypothetical protein
MSADPDVTLAAEDMLFIQFEGTLTSASVVIAHLVLQCFIPVLMASFLPTPELFMTVNSEAILFVKSVLWSSTTMISNGFVVWSFKEERRAGRECSSFLQAMITVSGSSELLLTLLFRLKPRLHTPTTMAWIIKMKVIKIILLEYDEDDKQFVFFTFIIRWNQSESY